jgi:hypothetical protein
VRDRPHRVLMSKRRTAGVCVNMPRTVRPSTFPRRGYGTSPSTPVPPWANSQRVSYSDTPAPLDHQRRWWCLVAVWTPEVFPVVTLPRTT